MIRLRDFRIGWRLLISEPAYSVIVVGGLTVGFAACFLLLGYVHYSFTYDAQVPDINRVYLIKQRLDVFATPIWFKRAQLPFAALVKKSGLAEQSSYVYHIGTTTRFENRLRKIELSVVEPDFQKIFNIHALEGDLDATLTRLASIALTASAAQKIFGTPHALNKKVEIGATLFQIGAILPDPPSNTNQKYEALVGPRTLAWEQARRDDEMNNWHLILGEYFVKLPINATPDALNKILQQANNEFGFNAGNDAEAAKAVATTQIERMDIMLLPISDAYFDETLANTNGDHGVKRIVIGLGLIALCIALIAAINYVNLAIVRTGRRQKEIGLHKILGASISNVVGRFMAESVLVSTLASCLGLILAWLLLPWFSGLMSRPMDNLITAQNCIVVILFGVSAGILSGTYPAWIAARVNARESLTGRGNVETRSGLWVRRVLTIMQFSVAMALAGLTVTIVWQTNFACNINPGYDPDNLIVLGLPLGSATMDDMDSPEHRAHLALRTRLATLSGVVGIAASLNPPGKNQIVWPFETKSKFGATIEMSGQQVSANFFEIYKIKARAGRLFESRGNHADSENSVVLNWTAAKALGFASPEAAVGQMLPDSARKMKIIGIAPDIRLQSMRGVIEPVAYVQSDGKPGRTPILTIRVDAGDMQRVEKEVEKIWPEFFPSDVLAMRSVQDAIAESYADDVRLAKLLSAASVLAIAIAAFGIYVLSAYNVQRRTREIVLRKLYGASGNVIGRLLALEFGGLLGISALIGLPLAWLGSAKYLVEFVERASMGVWPLLLALVLALLIAALATVRHVLIAMRLKPAQALAT